MNSNHAEPTAVHVLNWQWLGRQDYLPTWQAMRALTDARDAATSDQLWGVEHPPVFTQGQAGRPEHLLDAHGVPVVQTDRGGQITYHGPGQLVVYMMIDFKRLGLGVRELVRHIEQAVIDLLAEFGITGNGDVDAPGVYVDGAKIASLGLRIRNGRCYHGLALNVDLDLTPFHYINPCGYQGLAVTQMADFGIQETPASLAAKMADKITQQISRQG